MNNRQYRLLALWRLTGAEVHAMHARRIIGGSLMLAGALVLSLPWPVLDGWLGTGTAVALGILGFLVWRPGRRAGER